MIASSLINRVSLAVIAALVGPASGCACHGPRQGWCGEHGGQFFSGYVPVCFGYSSTCWHPWPGECITCPTYAFPPQVSEPLPAAKPIQPETSVPPMPLEVPMPEPSSAEANLPPATTPQPPAPQPEEQATYVPAVIVPPQVTLETAPQPEVQPQYAPPPPVLTVAPVVTPASLLRTRPVVQGQGEP
jgi:hypothetical protein